MVALRGAGYDRVVQSALIFGARNLGRAVAHHLASTGMNVAVAARSEDSLARVKAELPATVTIQTDAREHDQVESAFTRAQEAFGQIDVVVVAISPSTSGGARGSGEISDCSPSALDPYTRDLLPALFTVLSVGGRFLRAQGSGAYIQLTGGSSRRWMARGGPWAAGAFATRGMIQAAASELRDQGVHVALLIVDATIENDRTRERLVDKDPIHSTSEQDIAEAVAYLAGQSERAWTHELQLTPRGDRWVP
jgi:NADP-dependent 3-hydroxy acid dehydrogenase YdfG